MKSIVALGILMLACFHTSAEAGTPARVLTVREYLAQCSAKESLKNEECSGPLMAIFLIGHYPMTTTSGTPGGLCLPKDDGNTAPLLVEWLKGQPSLQDEPVPAGLFYAAKSLYPCPVQAAPSGDFEAATDIRAYILAEAIPVSMANSFGSHDDGPDVLLGWRLAKTKEGKIRQVPDMFGVIFNDTGEALPDFGDHPTILANVFVRRLAHDKPPSESDDTIAKTGIPTFFIGSRGQDVWEIARHNGAIAVRLVSDENVGPWEDFQSDPSRYHYYAQHFLDGRTVEQDFHHEKTAHLAAAACSGDKALVTRAINAGANPNDKGVDGDTPIFWSVDCASVDGTEALLVAGADPNYRLPGRPYTDGNDHFRTHQYSATYAAMVAGNLPLLKLLLKHGGDPNSYLDDRSDDTIMWSSVVDANIRSYKSHDPHAWDTYEVLLDAYKRRHFEDDTGHTIATRLAEYGHLGRVEELLRLGYDHDLVNLGQVVQNQTLGGENGEKEKLIDILRKKGVCFPVHFWTERGGTLTMNADKSIRIQWDEPRPGCLPEAEGPTLLTKDNFAYSQLLYRAGGLNPGETKSVPPAPIRKTN